MARKNRNNHRFSRRATIALLVVFMVGYCILSSVQDKYDLDLGIPDIPAVSVNAIELIDAFFGDIKTPTPPANLSDTEIAVHFIDIGQGKAILVQTDTETALIDAGDNDKGDIVLAYLRGQGIKRLDYLIGTHPHADHIGGMDTVIRGMEIGAIIMPEIPDEVVPTTKTYTDVLLAIAEKGYQITPAKPGKTYRLGPATLTILGPVKAYTDLNNLSIVTRLDYEDTSFLFTGDIEAEAEQDILQSGRNVSALVLDVAHHGSRTSSSKGFLQAAQPKYAIVSCAMDNSYGHPHREPMERLQASGAITYRTDLQGSIIVSTDGSAIEIITEK